MPRTELYPHIAARLVTELGERLREFPLEVKQDETRLYIVLRGAAGSVTALRGLREKLQPIMKKLLREQRLGPKFQTVDSTHDSDMHIQIEIP